MYAWFVPCPCAEISEVKQSTEENGNGWTSIPEWLCSKVLQICKNDTSERLPVYHVIRYPRSQQQQVKLDGTINRSISPGNDPIGNNSIDVSTV